MVHQSSKGAAAAGDDQEQSLSLSDFSGLALLWGVVTARVSQSVCILLFACMQCTNAFVHSVWSRSPPPLPSSIPQSWSTHAIFDEPTAEDPGCAANQSTLSHLRPRRLSGSLSMVSTMRQPWGRRLPPVPRRWKPCFEAGIRVRCPPRPSCCARSNSSSGTTNMRRSASTPTARPSAIWSRTCMWSS